MLATGCCRVYLVGDVFRAAECCVGEWCMCME